MKKKSQGFTDEERAAMKERSRAEGEQEQRGRGKRRGRGKDRKFVRGLAAIDVDSPNGYLAAGAKWGWIDRSGWLVGVFTRADSYRW